MSEARTWFIADTHFGRQPAPRRKATKLSCAELDELISDNWRRLVADSDVVWHLGDVGDPSIVARLPGHKHLIMGNDRAERDAAIDGGFLTAVKRAQIDTAQYTVELVHIPKDAKTGGVVFHGHLHSERASDPRFVCLSVDRWRFSPVLKSDAVGMAQQQLETERA